MHLLGREIDALVPVPQSEGLPFLGRFQDGSAQLLKIAAPRSLQPPEIWVLSLWDTVLLSY